MGGLIGLDMTAVFAIAGALQIDIDAQTLRGLQCLECLAVSEQSAPGQKSNYAMVADYCQKCITAGLNTDCDVCDLSQISTE